jgi:tRNA(fMet)-specific endonuclease VapC
VDIVFIDSCIVIDFIKEIEDIKKQSSQIKIPCINFIVEMELLQGAKDKRELKKIVKELNSFNRLYFQNEIAKLSTQLLKDFALSHNLQIPDAIIAATCLVYDIPLFTHNKRDFKFIPNLELYDIWQPG